MPRLLALARAAPRTLPATPRALPAAPRALHTASASASTTNAAELAHFSRLAAQWWDEHGEFRLLHRMNPVRVEFVLATLRAARARDPEHDPARDPAPARALAGLDVLDVGCGGGLLSESLARLGADTLGVDAARANIAVAAHHAAADPALAPRLRYAHGTAEALLAAPRRFDAVCALEVLEHVDHPAAFLRACAALVKPGGHLFLSTIARTPPAYLLTILLAEHVLRAVAPGTHTYAKFVRPDELRAFVRDDLRWPAAGTALRGIVYLPWAGRWALAAPAQPGATACNYVFAARKPPA